MILEQMSPLTRRIVALGILVLLLLGLLNLIVVPLFSAVSANAGALEDSRFRRERLEALQARPAPPPSQPVAPDLYFSSPDRDAAAAMVTAAINAAAARSQIAVENLAIQPEEAGAKQTLSLSLAARGNEEALVSFINEIERGQPLLRFRTWAIAGSAPAGAPAPSPAPAETRLTGTLLAVWSPPS